MNHDHTQLIHPDANVAPVLGVEFGTPYECGVVETRFSVGPNADKIKIEYGVRDHFTPTVHELQDLARRQRGTLVVPMLVRVCLWVFLVAMLAAAIVSMLGAGTIDARTTRYAKLIAAIEQHESVGGTKLYGDYQGDKNKNGAKDPDEFAAHGWLHMWKISVDEANRIAKLNKMGVTYTYADRMDRAKSHAMFVIIAEHHSKGERDEVVARRWNGGPDGDSDPNTEQYWEKIKSILEAKEAKAAKASGGGK